MNSLTQEKNFSILAQALKSINEPEKLFHGKEHHHSDKVAAHSGKYFISYTSDREVIFKTYKVLKKLNTKKTNNPI